ncbi:metallophosphoesterase [Spirochaetia bacterium]|nr:metallophosphoesterase [Spirochaetia bacterium]
MKILYIAELVGKAGVYCFKKLINELKKETEADFVIVCADGATGAGGLGMNHAGYLQKLGANVITLGDFCFYKKDLTENIDKTRNILRPANLSKHSPGKGEGVFKTKRGERIAAAVLLGQSSFSRIHAENPIDALEILLTRLKKETPFIIMDFHAQATAEKQTLFAAASGHCTAVIGSHCRVQTADARISGGTALITDAGRTGSALSCGGNDARLRINQYISGIPDWTKEAWDYPQLQGVLIEANATGEAAAITTICRNVG